MQESDTAAKDGTVVTWPAANAAPTGASVANREPRPLGCVGCWPNGHKLWGMDAPVFVDCPLLLANKSTTADLRMDEGYPTPREESDESTAQQLDEGTATAQGNPPRVDCSVVVSA